MTTEEDPTKAAQPSPPIPPAEPKTQGSNENEQKPSEPVQSPAPVVQEQTTVDVTESPAVADTVQHATEVAAVENVVQTIEVSATPAPAEVITTETPDAVETPTPVESPGTAIEASAPTAGAPTSASDDNSTDRVRQKLGAASGDKPVGSVDLQSQRPEIPSNTEPVEIPGTDDLAEDLDAEIAAAMATDVVVPDMTVPVPEEELRVSSEAEASVDVPPIEVEEVGLGSRVKGIVQHIHGDDVFLNAGLLSDVIISLKQFGEGKQPEVGAPLEAVIENIDADGLFRARLPEAKTKAGGNWDGLAVGQVVDCTVTATNKGGLQVTVSNLKGFLPASQVDLGYVSELEKYVGQTFTVQITEVKPKKRNLVVSRRAILQAERESAQAGFWETLEVGQDFPGTVKTLKNYGAFVNLGPIDGFLHVGEISWSRINHPNEVLKEGQEVQVRILKIDKEKSRISLGMKQLMQNPWQGLSDRYPSERIVNGKVTRVADFGAFVELEPGVEGLVHISQLAWRRVNTVAEVLKVGDEKDFQVLEVDQKRKRVSLSLKALEQKPESVRKAEAEEESRPVRKPNPNLRGGAGDKGGGGLFGNPSDFNT